MPVKQNSSQRVMTVREYIRLNAHRIANTTLGRKATAVYGRPNTFNRDSGSAIDFDIGHLVTR